MSTESMTSDIPPLMRILSNVVNCSGVGFFPGALVSMATKAPAKQAKQSTVVAPMPVWTGQNW